MKDLINALEIRKRYNEMLFDEFIKEYEKYFNIKVRKEVLDSFQETGLSNVDFLTSNYINAPFL